MAHSEAHTKSRLISTFETFVSRAHDDIRTDLRNPRYPTLKINGDRKARWEAAMRMILSGELVQVGQIETRPAHRAAPGEEPRLRTVVEVRLPDVDDWDARRETQDAKASGRLPMITHDYPLEEFRLIRAMARMERECAADALMEVKAIDTKVWAAAVALVEEGKLEKVFEFTRPLAKPKPVKQRVVYGTRAMLIRRNPVYAYNH